MSDTLRFYTMDELQALSLAELAALWELVPTERQRRYKAVYDREVRNAGASGSDALELQVAGELLARYTSTALVPIGARWARTPARIQAAAKRGTDLLAPEAEAERATSKKPPVAVIAGAGVFCLILALVVLPRLGGRGSRQAVSPTATVTATVTATPGRSPTPTPIALEDQDPVIRGGDSDRAAAFPVNLRVTLADSAQPRVFVVQRKVIQTAEWNFDPNPDTASYVAGLTVRPVIGVPFSAENAALFQSVGEGTTFTLQMNTGAALRFTFDGRLAVSRSDTAIFRQVGPGLVLVLIGERDADNAPTASRLVVTTRYLSEQELARDGALTELPPAVEPMAAPTPAPTLPPFSRLDVQVISVDTVPGRITTRLRLYNGADEALHFGPETIWLALGYAPEPPGPRVLAEGLEPFEVLPGQAADLTLHWAWAGEPCGSLGIGSYQFAVSLAQ